MTPTNEAIEGLRRRLGYVVQGIDGGRYREPMDAVDEILVVLASVAPDHRAELDAWLRTLQPTIGSTATEVTA